jgi:hypothetical protein
LITKKVTKKATSKKKSKDVGTSKRLRKDDTSEEEEEPDNPNDSDFDPDDESASASFMVEEEGSIKGEVALLISLVCLITQSLGGSGPKGNLLLLGMQMLIISLVTV